MSTVVGWAPPTGWDAERHAEVAERVRKWDAGEIVWSLEMGGMGPGYEQAIQLLHIEMLRDALALPIPEPKDADNEKWGDAAISRTSHNGYSGAQVGAARWLAWQVCTKGYEDVRERSKQHDGNDDRAMMCSNDWPTTSRK